MKKSVLKLCLIRYIVENATENVGYTLIKWVLDDNLESLKSYLEQHDTRTKAYKVVNYIVNNWPTAEAEANLETV